MVVGEDGATPPVIPLSGIQDIEAPLANGSLDVHCGGLEI